MRFRVFALCLVFALPALAGAPDYSAAISDARRPATDSARDAARKPADMLAFAGLNAGLKVMDLIPGGGYFTRLFAAAVEPSGHVYAYQPTEFDSFLKGKEPPVTAVAKSYPDVTVIRASVNTLTVPEKLDIIWTSQNYHDFHNIPDVKIETINRAIWSALRPGGTYLVLDHAAEAGSGTRDTNTLHRIDKQTVVQEVTSAGFELSGESDILNNKADPHTAKVFDPSVRGHTDQFILKFKKKSSS